MASGQPSGVPLPSRKTVSGQSERPPLRTRGKNVAPAVGRRAQYLLMCFGTFYVWLEMKFWPRRIFFADYHQAEAREPASLSHFTGGELNLRFCTAQITKRKPVCRCVFIARRSHGAHFECVRFVYETPAPLLICSPAIFLSGRSRSHFGACCTFSLQQNAEN